VRRVRIGTQDVVIEFASIADGEFGEFHAFPSPRVIVNSSVPIEVQRLTLLHELLHAISELYGLGLTESQVRCMEQGLGQVMSEPDVWEFIGGRI
jgi:hypothetical protein